jgi:putative ABC transport system ATP-binding protein
MSCELKDIKFSYPGASELVLDVPVFLAKKNEKVFLFGPSGCGKTTFLETIAGVLSPQSGSISVCGTQIQNLSASKRDQLRADKMGYIFQNFNLIPYLTVKENITLPSDLKSEKKQKSTTNDLEMICSELGITYFLNKTVTELSIGQQQRVAAARALLGKPELILADEPTSALDFDHREKFIQLLFKLANKSETAIIFVSHDRTLEKLFDRSVNLTEINRAKIK